MNRTLTKQIDGCAQPSGAILPTTGLQCHDVSFAWPRSAVDGLALLQSVHAHFCAGRISLITGNSGAGKSTLLHLLAGLLRPTSGNIYADGRPVSRWSATHRDLWRRRVGIVFQHHGLIEKLTVWENLILPLIPRGLAWADIQTQARRQIGAHDLAPHSHSRVQNLSGGQRQRVALARAMMGGPRFLLADEPTAFQDDVHATAMIDHFQHVAEQGATVVICSHDPRLRQNRWEWPQFNLSAGRLHAPALKPT